FLEACASNRPPVPVGTIPKPPPLSSTDEQYGHQVLGELTRRFPLDTDDKRIERVRKVVDRLTGTSITGSDPWHVYVLVDNDFKNAAATRGNHLFIWTAMLDQLKNDDELASILAHEVAHVLAGHTNPDPVEQASEILSGLAGVATRISVQGSNVGALAQISGALVEELVKGFIVNPGSQKKELEADHIGLMLMAEAKYNPQKAIDFWERAQSMPEFGGGSGNAFFSSHPSSVERLNALKAALPAAMERYYGKKQHV
ncbi:MAG: M48 family metallopeptidase, partial [Bdellovibrionales bacterium]|nr:M48 family metallopeptidase [Bdellovibrionales bacterium]